MPDQESRKKVHDYIERAIEESRGGGDDKGKGDGQVRPIFAVSMTS